MDTLDYKYETHFAENINYALHIWVTCSFDRVRGTTRSTHVTPRAAHVRPRDVLVYCHVDARRGSCSNHVTLSVMSCQATAPLPGPR